MSASTMAEISETSAFIALCLVALFWCSSGSDWKVVVVLMMGPDGSGFTFIQRPLEHRAFAPERDRGKTSHRRRPLDGVKSPIRRVGVLPGCECRSFSGASLWGRSASITELGSRRST